MSSNEIVGLLKGPKGTKVNVKIKRTGVSELLPFTIVRDKIPQYSLDVSYMVNKEIGYLKFNRFSATTHQEFKTAIENLFEKGMNKLILDLRGNTGGYLDAAIKMADEILEANKLIVYTEGRSRPKQIATARGKGLVESTPLVILIDEWSASASEIVAGAVQDNDRGVIIGRRSFGKGLVQEQVQLQDGSALLLTVARYYTPSGRSIQKPYDNGSDEYYHNFLLSMIDEDDGVNESDKEELEKVFFTTSGRKVFGGGGIMPDIYIPVQTGEKFVFLNQLINRGVFYRFAFEYGDRVRSQFSKFEDADDYIKNYFLTPQVFGEFLNFAKDQGVSKPSRIDSEVEATIKSYLKAYLGRVVFGVGAFYPIINLNDKPFMRALEVLSGDEFKKLLKPFS
jgi:carboxyl-terminal processing protease